jgi:uncharacterized protein YecE (DUF72 family)
MFPASDPQAEPADAVEPAPPDDGVLRLGRRLPRSVFLGTSSWSFPGWRGIVYRGSYSESALARHGLAAYARHPVLRAVGIDRGFYRPLTRGDYERYARQVPAEFRLLIKAPSLFTDAVKRGEGGVADADNPEFLNAQAAIELFVVPAMAGLGDQAGPLVFQLSPLPRSLLRGDGAVALIERLGAFLAALPREVDGRQPVYAVELRNGELLTPRLVRTLRAAGTRLCLGLHARMPDARRQSAALRALDAAEADGDAWRLKGPLIVRWILHAGLSYEAAKNRYAPFDRLIDVDVFTRGALAHLIQVALRSEQPAYVIVGNKAEGSAPLTCIELAKAVVG